LSGLATGLGDIEGVDADRIFVPSLDQRYQLDRDGGPLLLTEEAPARLVNSGAEALRKGWDWHNELSVLNLDLHKRLQRMPRDDDRLKLIRKLEKLVSEE